MNYTTLGIGLLLVGAGVLFLIMRLKSPEKLDKYMAMKKNMGEKKAMYVHTFFYTLIPFILGGLVIYAATRGETIIEFLRN